MRVHLKGIHTVSKRLADGRVVSYRYAWRGGPRLTGTPGSPEFIRSYHDAHAARTKPPAGILFTLISEFKGSAEFQKLAKQTRKDYGRYLSVIEQDFGDMPLTALNDPRLRGDLMQWRDTMAATPRKADFAWTVLARVFSFAKNRGRIALNPCERGGRLYTANRADKIWTDDLIGLAVSGLPSRLRWALLLALWTGQREGDLLRLAWSAIEADKIRVLQSKTGKRLLIPIAEPLRIELSQIPKVSPVILTNTFGKPWTGDGFRASWGRAVQRLGIVGLTFHDLRGSSITRLAEAGCTESEIASITGHSHSDIGAMLDRHYLSRTNALAENAIRRLESLEQERKL